MFRAKDFNIAWGVMSIILFVFLCMFVFFLAVDFAQGAEGGTVYKPIGPSYYYRWDYPQNRWVKVLISKPPYNDSSPPPPPQTTADPQYVVPAKPSMTKSYVVPYLYSKAMLGYSMGTLSYPMPPAAEYTDAEVVMRYERAQKAYIEALATHAEYLHAQHQAWKDKLLKQEKQDASVVEEAGRGDRDQR
jgi:hypothetical protein